MSATVKIYAAVRFVQETQCIAYILLKKFAFFPQFIESYFQFQKILLTAYVMKRF